MTVNHSLIALGFTTTESNSKIIYQKDNIRVIEYVNGVHTLVKLRTLAHGFRILGLIRPEEPRYHDLIMEIVASASFGLQAHTPYGFSDIDYEIVPSSWGDQGLVGFKVRAKMLFQTAMVIGIVSMDTDGMITDLGISVPDRECWYLLDCVAVSGGTFNIITDGEVFYSVARMTNHPIRTHVTTDSGKRTIDLGNASKLDRIIVTRAISEWCKPLSS